MEEIRLLDEPILCYVHGQFAWFTNLPLKHQSGDDWNDAPYEHNAGYPYDWREYMAERGIPKYELMIIVWSGAFETPADYHFNSPYSVEMINRGDVAWLRVDPYVTNEKAKPIFAGVTIREFKRLIWLGQGEIYERVDPESSQP